jgi:carbon storage regulator CsrA
MLVLERKTDEKIIITCGKETITILVTQVRDRKSVKIGIEAPKEFRITREPR